MYSFILFIKTRFHLVVQASLELTNLALNSFWSSSFSLPKHHHTQLRNLKLDKNNKSYRTILNFFFEKGSYCVALTSLEQRPTEAKFLKLKTLTIKQNRTILKSSALSYKLPYN